MTERSQRPVDHAGLQVLTFDECLRLAASEPVGRVAFADDGDVEVFPVNHCVVDGMIAFRVAEGSKLGAAIQRKVVAFEVDRYDRTQRDGWSVVVKGRAEVVTDEQTAVRLQASGIRPWPNAVARPHWVAVRADEVSGRHL